MGVALGRGQHARGFAIGLAELAVGGARDQATSAGAALHRREQRGEAGRGQGQIIAHRRQCAPIGGFGSDDVEDQPGDERLGFLVPVGVARLPRRVVDQRVGERVGIFRQIEAGGIEPVERIVAGRGPARHAEPIEAPDRTFSGAGAGGDAGVLALGVDAGDRAIEQEQVGDDRADGLARGWGPSSADAPRRHSGAACPTSPSGRSGDPRSPPAFARRRGRRSGRTPAARFAGWRHCD
ncbi:hypothetical protein L479_01903 [Exiguobacterium sp. S17]|nr:hypothetical protein L479_01903 [Exiguobacterium sp. S17]